MKQDTVNKINNMLDLVEQIIAKKGLAAVPTETFNMRERGEDMIYFSKGTWNKDTKYLVPSPTVKQKLYKEFFSDTGENKVLPRYTVYVYENHIEFTEKVTVKGKLIKNNLRRVL